MTAMSELVATATDRFKHNHALNDSISLATPLATVVAVAETSHQFTYGPKQ